MDSNSDFTPQGDSCFTEMPFEDVPFEESVAEAELDAIEAASTEPQTVAAVAPFQEQFASQSVKSAAGTAAVPNDGQEVTEESNAVDNAALEEEARRKAEHEASEAQRKAEYDARQAEKKKNYQLQLLKMQNMSDDDVMIAAAQRAGQDTEKITRRSLKECISEHIQTLCFSDPAFARLTMHPRKNMIHCFMYINR